MQILSEELCLSMQREEILAFRNEDFQKQLHELWAAAGNNHRMRKHGRESLCLQIQIPIVAKFGFEASQRGVWQSMSAVTAQMRQQNQQIAQNTAWLVWLTDPSQQLANPLGPELQLAATENQSGSPQFPCMPLSAVPPPELSEQACLALQGEELSAFREHSFQKQLHEVWAQAGCDQVVQKRRKDSLCLKIHIPIAAKFGFEASLRGVHHRMHAVTDEMRTKNQHIANNSAWLNWLTDPSQQFAFPLGPDAATSTHQKDESPQQSSQKPRLVKPSLDLPEQSCLAIQSEELIAFRAESFQKRLHEIWAQSEGNLTKQRQLKENLCLEVQIPIVAKFGFDESRQGVFDRMRAGKSLAKTNVRILENGLWLRWLTDPLEQFACPFGPGSEKLSSDAKQALANSSFSLLSRSDTERNNNVPDTLPFWRTLAKVPRAIAVRVTTALTGRFLCGFEFDSRDLVLMVKQRIHGAKEFPVREQELILGSRLLSNKEVLGDVVDRFLMESRTEACSDDDTDDEELCDLIVDVDLIRLPADRANVLDHLRSELALPWEFEQVAESRDTVIAVVREAGRVLQHLNYQLRQDVEVVSAAVENCGMALEFAAEDLRSSRDIVLKAVQNDGLALQFAEEAVRADYEVVLCALASDSSAIQFAAADQMDDSCLLGVANASANQWQLLPTLLQARILQLLHLDGPFFAFGSWDAWTEFKQLQKIQTETEIIFKVCISVRDVVCEYVEFQIVQDRDLAKRFHPDRRGNSVVGPDSQAAACWHVDLPTDCLALSVYWDPRGSRTIRWKFE